MPALTLWPVLERAVPRVGPRSDVRKRVEQGLASGRAESMAQLEHQLLPDASAA